MEYKFEDFIGIFDNVFTKEDCNYIINYYNSMTEKNLVIDFKHYSDSKLNTRKDQTVFMFDHNTWTLNPTHFSLELFSTKFWPCYEKYVEEYTALQAAAKHGILGLRVQKTLPGGGFHQWHFENGEYANASRIVTMMLYLNDVEEGGETEFLYYHKRIKPKAGRLLIWPSGYPHTHRGNPPLSGEKYIITGWLNLVE